MADKPLTRRISAIFTAVAAAALLSPHNLTLDGDQPAEPAVTTHQTLHPVGTPVENVQRPADNGSGGGFGGGKGISLPTALAVKIGRP